MAPKESSWPFLKYPTNRENVPASIFSWLEGKQVDDGAEGLWRIHDGLYDLTEFVKKHPGGSMWLEVTKGTDVTEAFEVHHVTTTPENMLPKFFVRKATTPRNSPYTFHPNGFYRTLKRKVQNYYGNRAPPFTRKSAVMLDGIVILTLITLIASGIYRTYYLGALAGILMGLIINCGHNFVHAKDTWRIYYFHLTSFSAREWRISHGLSHHLYTNTLQDLEMSGFEPLFQWLPESSKTLTARYLSWIYFPFGCGTICYVTLYTRIKYGQFKLPDYLILASPILIFLSSGFDIFLSISIWAVQIFVTGMLFGFIGFTAAHHHPDIFHDGDLPREDSDWGLHQIDATHDRVEIRNNTFVTLLLFGEHTLHHMFPTLDHALLPQIEPLYRETLDEFGIEPNMNTVGTLFIGAFKQLARTEKNKNIRKQKKI